MSTTAAITHGSYLMPSFEHATVADAMHPGILSCGPDATLAEVARLMSTYHVHFVAVSGTSVEDGGERLVWGVVTDRDVLEAALSGGAEPSAGAIAKRPIIAVEATMSLRAATEVMVGEGASHVVVIDAQSARPLGVLSSADVAGTIAWGEA